VTTLYQSDVGPIKSIVLKHPKDAFVSDEAIKRQWKGLNYQNRPDLARAVDEYERFVTLLNRFDIDLHFLPRNESVGLDSIYSRDASIVCSMGMIICNMGKAERSAEPAAQETLFHSMGIPILGAITGDGRVEAGDVAWIDEKSLAIGRGYRTNDEGIRQLRELLGDCIDELVVVPLPHWRGPNDVFHLMSILSPIDHNLALVYSPLMPVPFREALLSRGIQLVEVPDSEFETMGCNVLAVAPRKCVMLTGNPQTRLRLERAGAEVHEFKGQEICIKGGGGPTCLTRPIVRSQNGS
jgi:N-dimethylarginine dimethylaminohydrolase